MRVLWISNIVFPEVNAKLFGEKIGSGSGGWLMSLAAELKDRLDLAVAAPSSRVRKLTNVDINGLVFYVFPIGKGNKKYNKTYEDIWKEIKNEFNPDIVHIHGTEYSHGLAYINACGVNNVIVSIQGVMTEIAKHYLDGLSAMEIIKNLTLHDICKQSLFGAKREAKTRAESEPQILSRVKYVIGRTCFDHAHALSFNPSIQYYHCDEVLRDEFYTGCWSYEKCEPHTIFLSSSRYPLKGFHMVLRALPSIIMHYPDTKVRIAGSNNMLQFSKRTTKTGYQAIVSDLINRLKLNNCLEFLGVLSAEEMKTELLRANVFISPSSNENSSNAIGEAQLLGVPCLASYVGGTPDLIPNNACGELYNFSDIDTLAFKVCSLFETSKDFNNSQMRAEATRRHDRIVNAKQTLKIYHHVLNEIK